MSLLLSRALLFADDCALIAQTANDLQSILNDFAGAASRYGLTISITTTKVMLQPKLRSFPLDPLIKIGGKQLKALGTFCYLGGFLSQNASIDDEITSRISKAIATFGRLHQRLWSDHGISLSTKIDVYRIAVLTMLLYESESWTWYCRHLKKKNLTSSIRCLRKICGTSWKDRTKHSCTKTLREGIEALLIKSQLRWAGHITIMKENRIPKAVFYGELVGGQQKKVQGCFEIQPEGM